MTFMTGHPQYPSNSTSYCLATEQVFSSQTQDELTGAIFSGGWGPIRVSWWESPLSTRVHKLLWERRSPVTSAPETRSGTSEKPNNKQVGKSNNLSLAWIGFNFCLQHFSFNSLNLGRSLRRTGSTILKSNQNATAKLLGVSVVHF